MEILTDIVMQRKNIETICLTQFDYLAAESKIKFVCLQYYKTSNLLCFEKIRKYLIQSNVNDVLNQTSINTN